MPGRRVSLVCRDCGEVSHHQLEGLRPDAMVACGACGLLADPSPARGFSLGLALARPPPADATPPGGARPGARPGPGARRPARVPR